MEYIPSLRWNSQTAELNGLPIGTSVRQWSILGKLFVTGLLSLSFLFLSSCSPKDNQVMVFAASSLVEVLAPIGDTFSKEKGIPIAFNFGGSDSLAQQIRRGARADVYLSAGTRPMDILEKEGFLYSQTRRNILTNQLVVVSRQDFYLIPRSVNIFSFPQISRVAVTDPNLAPAGRYSITALKNIGVWENISGKVVFAPNDRATLAYVESGNADIGIVYRTDLINSTKLRVIFELPKDSHDLVIYPASVLKDSSNKEMAIGFVQFLADKKAKNIFREHGFDPIN